jgi:D-sedoheptulose 7-phosphate isomerase
MTFISECIDALESLKTSVEYQKFNNEFKSHRNIIIIGNGGSNAVASHISQDYVNMAYKRSLTFSDPSMLTCFMNDYGVENAYKEFLRVYAEDDSLIILISSSGKSMNIINCIKYCSENNLDYGLLTAFNYDNPAKMLAIDAKFNYWIDTVSYGVAECVHQIFLHAVVSNWD